jgi:hypothetical protein
MIRMIEQSEVTKETRYYDWNRVGIVPLAVMTNEDYACSSYYPALTLLFSYLLPAY